MRCAQRDGGLRAAGRAATFRRWKQESGTSVVRRMIGEETIDVAGLRLGDIVYSNCFPVHARLLDTPRPGDPDLVPGVPSRLNGLLRAGEIDVAPSSSIEYARNASRYRILPDLVIGSRGPVRSILFISRIPPSELDGRRVAIPSASATSVVLLKILLHAHWGVRPEYHWFDQAVDEPLSSGADAALFIGDVALREGLHSTLPHRHDLGEVWNRFTGLPFAFAVWQASGGTPAQLGALHRLLVESRAYYHQHAERLADTFSARYDLPASLLAPYWRGLSYDLDGAMIEGLRRFYSLAAEIGEIDAAPELRWA